MASVLPLSERLQAHTTPPTELAAWSTPDADEEMYFDERGLRYYYSPQRDLGYQAIDLSVGFETSGFDPLVPFKTTLDPILKAMMRVEQKRGKRIDASIVTWRGVMMDLVLLSQGKFNRQLQEERLELDVIGFDGQIFLCQHPKVVEESIKQRSQLLLATAEYMYSGYSFEYMATLPKPPSECTRNDVEKRYISVPKVSEHTNYMTLVKSGVGKVGVLYGAEIDCIDGRKDPNNKLKRYVELKTSTEDPGQNRYFETKLLKAWLQSFLGGVPKIIHGFRDSDMRLVSIQEYETAKVPLIVRKSHDSKLNPCWNASDVIGFYARLLQWLKEKVQEGETYKLVYEARGAHLSLRSATLDYSERKYGFLADGFVDWRATLLRETLRNKRQKAEENLSYPGYGT